MFKVVAGFWYRGVLVITVVACVALSTTPVVRADSTFHTEQIPLTPAGAAPLQSGFVVDIHTNGPVNYALERYVLNGAQPDTTYQVSTQLSFDSSCSTVAASVPDATFGTNAAGNGEAGSVLTVPAVLSFGLSLPTTVYVTWIVTEGSSVVYQTNCTTVALDTVP